MIDHILRTLAVRAEHELGWMAEEMAAIDGVGARVGGFGAAGGRSGRRGARRRSARSVASGLHAAEITDDYNRATEVLSRCCGGDLHRKPANSGRRSSALLDQRLAHETDVIGEDFQLVGRS